MFAVAADSAAAAARNGNISSLLEVHRGVERRQQCGRTQNAAIFVFVVFVVVVVL